MNVRKRPQEKAISNIALPAPAKTTSCETNPRETDDPGDLNVNR